jgi:hypothetical protein
MKTLFISHVELSGHHHGILQSPVRVERARFGFKIQMLKIVVIAINFGQIRVNHSVELEWKDIAVQNGE